MNNKQALRELENWYRVYLSPCPFCGNDAEAKPAVSYIKVSYSPDVHFTVQCTNCGCEPDHCLKTPEEAISFWNKRSIMPKSDEALTGFEIAKSKIIALIKLMTFSG